MGKQNNTKQNGIAAKGSNPIVIKNKNLRTQNGSKPSGKQSLSANAASSKVSNSSVARNKTTTTAAAEDHSAIGAKGPTDRSQLNFPYDIRINGFSSMLNTVKKATPKVSPENDYVDNRLKFNNTTFCLICIIIFRSESCC